MLSIFLSSIWWDTLLSKPGGLNLNDPELYAPCYFSTPTLYPTSWVLLTSNSNSNFLIIKPLILLYADYNSVFLSLNLDVM